MKVLLNLVAIALLVGNSEEATTARSYPLYETSSNQDWSDSTTNTTNHPVWNYFTTNYPNDLVGTGIFICSNTGFIYPERNRITTLYSPGYGFADYSNGLQCDAVFKTERNPLQLVITFEDFDLEHQEQCGYDTLCIKGVKFCGNWVSGKSVGYIVPPNSTFTMMFSTDASEVRRGFKIKISARATQTSAFLQEISSGVGSSQENLKYDTKWQDEYSDTTCYRPPTANPYYGTTNDYNDSSTSTSYETPDYSSWDRTTYPRYDGTSSPSYVTGTPWPVKIEMCNHFGITYPQPGTTTIVQSPGYGLRPYDNNLNCQLQLRTQNHPLKFTITFDDFVTESSSECRFDALCVKGVKFCDTWPTGRRYDYIVPPYSTLTLRFTTDISQTFKGFQLSIQVEQVESCSSTLEVSGGVGSSYDRLFFSTTPQSQYFDRSCNGSSDSTTTTWPPYFGTTNYPNQGDTTNSFNWEACPGYSDISYISSLVDRALIDLNNAKAVLQRYTQYIPRKK